MSFRLSVIIPVYNVEQYIEECLNSIVNQTIGIDQIEVILINDHSTDNSISIAELYADRYDSIKIVHHKRNMGSGTARNTGLKLATSQLIAFIDADDYIKDNTFEMAIESMELTNSDLFIYEYEYFSPSNKAYPRNPSAQLFAVTQTVTDIREFPEIIFATSVCNKVFKRELIGDLKFTESRIEDVMFSTITTFLARKIYISNRCKYFYRKREESNSKTDEYYSNKESYLDHLNVNIQMHELINEYPEYKELIDWFNIRSLHPFIYNMVNQSFFTLKEKRDYFYKSKEVFTGTSSETIERLEKPISKYIVKSTQKNSFLLFFSTKNSMKLYNGIRKRLPLIQKAKKAALLGLCLVASFFYRFNRKYRNVWLVCERGYEAGDNGYSFFKYLCQNHPEIHAFYLMDYSNQQDFNKVNSIGEVIQYGSFKHKILFILAKYLVTAHRGTIEPWNYQQYKRFCGFLSKNQKYIFLQHGITKDDVSNVLGRKQTSFDLFITGAKPEFDYINSTFGYHNGEVVYTGFARFDDLHSRNTKKQILFMPTWRKKLAWSVTSNRRANFEQSDYFRRFQSLINNEELLKILDQNGYLFIFYLHHEMQQFIDCFSALDENIRIANENEFDFQILLKESEIIITDYSSVFFDFGYMNKPVIHYQFDSADFYENHYKPGYFSYELDGFGPVFTEEQDIVDYVKMLLDTGSQPDEKYRRRVERFFTLRDRKNCERIYQSIIELK